MAKTHQAILLLFNILIIGAVEGRYIPSDVKHPENFFSNGDRGYLIPGIGRGILPKPGEGYNPFTYNPITGKNNGIPGVSIPSIGVGINGIPGYIPGGDDTLVPNPGVEVPIPGRTKPTVTPLP